jgi:predicted transcriptional regulator
MEELLWQKKDFWNELSSSQQDEIYEGIKELDEGKKVTWESVLKEIS